MSHSSSVQSNHSLHSLGPVDLSDVEKSNPRKIPAKWTEEEEHAFVLYLQEQVPAAGDGVNFLKKYFNSTTQHLKDKFPNQHGGKKTASTCSSKWTLLKEEYFAVIDLKSASGFTWSDEHGARMASCNPIWKDYIKKQGFPPVFTDGRDDAISFQSISRGKHKSAAMSGSVLVVGSMVLDESKKHICGPLATVAAQMSIVEIPCPYFSGQV
ncbi:hypothetical protein EDD16DRAFT_1525598 [Pisolithus croceorrhizus]|nr:hypothetical protein EDD16DRAFT_1525598 [Pisolithus croceorrhizus]